MRGSLPVATSVTGAPKKLEEGEDSGNIFFNLNAQLGACSDMEECGTVDIINSKLGTKRSQRIDLVDKGCKKL